jgi:glutathione S-transferase
MNAPLTLVSHVLCPYAQRAAIVLHEKGATYDRINIDLSNKPAWFQLVSPLGKTPVLLVRNVPIFESAVICEYLDDTINPPLHPFNAVQRAHHRSWIEFASALLNLIGGLYSALHEDALARKAEELTDRLVQLKRNWAPAPISAVSNSRWSMRRLRRCFATSTCSKKLLTSGSSTASQNCRRGAGRWRPGRR